ncbi:MAG: hypothetical protein VKL39_02865 [Leptolyngbyaceae bacterium]|nr:hypothetical protein [Leptolyngbyaceae bacterium]
MANTVLAKMAVQIAANTADFNRKLSETNNKLSGFSSGITKIAGGLAAAFSAQVVAQFAFEVSKLAGEAEAVEGAFDKLENSEELLVRLKSATANTVSELALMKRTVQASNFGISLEALPRLLEFAAVRAQQTGQSVDYLVDSIVTGIGRKSPLILDNLGISAVALREKLNGVSVAAADVGQVADAVGKIASEQLEQMGSLADNAATKVSQLEAAWEDFKVAVGTAANETGLLSRLLEISTKALKDFSGEREGLNALENILLKVQAEGRFTADVFNQNVETLKRLKDEGNQITITYRDLVKLTSQWANPDTYKAVLTQLNGIVKVLDTPASGADSPNLFTPKTFQDLAKELSELKGPSETINTLTEKLNELTAIRNDSGEKEVSVINRQIKAIEEKIKRLKELGTVEEIALSRAALDTRTPTTGVTPLIGSTILTELTTRDPKDFVKPIQLINTAMAETVDITGNVVNGIASIADAFGSAIGGSENFGQAIIASLAGFAQQFGALLVATGVAEISFKKFSGPAMIAAGAGLIALGAAVRGAISRRPKLGGSGSFGGSARFSTPASNFNLAQNAPTFNLSPSTVIRGQDLYVIWENYNRNNRSTRS